MTSTMTHSSMANEPNVSDSIELSDKKKSAKRFQSTNTKQNTQSSGKPKISSPSAPIMQELRAEDIKEYRLWALISVIFCFFIVAPCIAFHHSRRIREMKKNQELTRAKIWSDRVNNLLMISTLIGLFIWFAILVVLGILLVMGAVY
mgnify:CR=1 FL=1